MRSRLLQAIVALCASFSALPAMAAEFPFSDVPASDPIYGDLKKLYERGVIDEPADGKFRPASYMDRDEFTAIAIGVGCRKCITPSVADVLKYRTQPFVDFPMTNPYFYCVSYAKDREIVRGYASEGSAGFTCENEKYWEGVPFCAANRTSRIEAAAVLLRQAGLWDEPRNSAGFSRTMQFSDVSDYWYGYAQKGVEIGILETKSGALRPNEALTKREFVKMAAVVFSINLCEVKGMSGDGTNSPSSSGGPAKPPAAISVSPIGSSCAERTAVFTPPQSGYDFSGEPVIVGASYHWEFVPVNGTGTFVSDGQCVSNVSLGSGQWIVRLTLTDPSSGNASPATATVPFAWTGSEGNSGRPPILIVAGANPLTPTVGDPVSFSSDVAGGMGPYSYRWDFADGAVVTSSDPNHVFIREGAYVVTVTVTDSAGNRAIGQVTVNVQPNLDTDGDGVTNANDRCPTVRGPASNSGCPNVDAYFPPAASTGSSISNADPTFGSGGASLAPVSVGNRCLFQLAQPAGAIFGTSSCSACPCEYAFDFNAPIRRCDILVPAVLSPNKERVYGRGPIYQLPGQ